MRIAIAGGGFSGAYTARRLVVEGIARPEQIEIFDPMNHRTKCGITPCGYGIHKPTLRKACKLAQLDGDFVIESFEKVKLGGVVAKADLCCFDKPAFIRACLDTDGLTLNRFEFPGGSFSIVIDATAWRKVIGRLGIWQQAQLTIYTAQVRLKREEMPVETMEITPLQDGGIGYIWKFPLKNEVHYGFGRVDKRISKLPGWFLPSNKNIICSCRGKIRASSPKYSVPIWGSAYPSMIVAVGESAGMISSATGGGCKEAIDGIEILIKNWGDWEKYEEELIKEFKWADREFKFIWKLYTGGKPNIGDYRMIQKNSRRVGFKLGLRSTIDLVKNLLMGGL